MKKIILLLTLTLSLFANDDKLMLICEQYDDSATEYLGKMAESEKVGNFEELQKNGNMFLKIAEKSVDACMQIKDEEYESVATFKLHTLTFIKEYIAHKYPNWNYKVGL